RLADNSKIGNALVNAHRNGKEVTVMLELRARFDELNNLAWKERFEMEGIKVLVGCPNKKVHAKLCIITKRKGQNIIQYGFVSTGNSNEMTAKIYSDFCLLTSNKSVMKDIDKVFLVLDKPKLDIERHLIGDKAMLFCPTQLRQRLQEYIDKEIEEARKGNRSHILVKVNSLSDKTLIKKLYEAAENGVKIELIVRGIYCAMQQESFKQPIRAISIVDEYLEHARVFYFYHGGKEHMYISSADWMTRNLDFRIEASVRIKDKTIRKQLLTMLNIQLADNVKARIHDNELSNAYVRNDKAPFRSQIEIYKYLKGL